MRLKGNFLFVRSIGSIGSKQKPGSGWAALAKAVVTVQVQVEAVVGGALLLLCCSSSRPVVVAVAPSSRRGASNW